MKKKLFLSNIRKMKSSYKRFLSLLFLSLLGVGFFCGIKGSSPDMLQTLHNYYKEKNVYDIEVVSNTGFLVKDIEALKDFNNLKDVVGIKSIDKLISIKDQEKAIKITSLSEVNKMDVIEGRLPEKENEIVIDEKIKKELKLKIGSSINIPNEELKTKEFTIVGFIKSPLYFSSFRGTTTIGNGELNYYSYVLESTFQILFYTSIDITLNTEEQTESDEYLSIVEENIEKLKTKKTDSSTWYFFTRKDNTAYASFIDATESLARLGSVFPIIFFFVAILISLISMTRMVLEDRSEIGTLKALGFSSFQIMRRYIFYAITATTIGGILGAAIGFAILPKIVWSIYLALFDIPNFVRMWSTSYVFIGIVVSLLCIVGATILSSIHTLKEKPSELMRPSAPISGKKIFLEHISFFWNRLKFSNKITLRNIFRYKRRVLVTIIGITGSTALILVGFGVKDSVHNLVDYHFNKIFIYDAMIRLKDGGSVSEVEKLLEENKEITSVIPVMYSYLDIYKEKEKRSINFIVPKESIELSKVVKLNDVKKKNQEFTLENGTITLSEKLAKLLNVSVGDSVQFLIDDTYKSIEVSHITENYFQDYAYMTKETYEKLFGIFTPNVIFIRESENYVRDFDKTIQKNQNVSNVVRKKTTSKLMEDVLSSLNSVVVVLILSSAILAFVILYNISNINISERKREISTLKVLGYYDKEVDAYITKENYLITIVGILLGLISGFYLSYYVISTCEPDYMMFSRDIKWISFVYAGLISFLFTIIVSRITHYNLKKIDMVESLKSIE